MANKGDIQHTLKSGSDASLYLTPVTSDGTISVGTDMANVIKARMTGESIKGTIETLESNELKSGRFASKKKLGNESANGNLDFEFSPDTFDALIESAWRGEFKAWTGDTEPNEYKIKSQWTDGSYRKYSDTLVESSLFGVGGLMPDLDKTNYKVSELKVGSTPKEFDILRKIGGVPGEDLWQRYQRMGVNTFNINVDINSIVTGSFGFMGLNSPKRVDTNGIKTNVEEGYGSSSFSDSYTAETFVDGLENVKSTNTDQFVSTCGNLWINGQNITWGQNISIDLNNNLAQKYAIMVKKAIATTSNKLDITGNYKSYVVKGKSEDVYNAAVDNETCEIMFILQDKEDDPDKMYLFQVYKASFDAPDSNGNGTESYDDSYGYTSFDEEAVRILKIEKIA